MTSNWQHTVLRALDENGASIFNLLLYALRNPHPLHAHHRDTLRQQTRHVFELWAEQFESETIGWVQRAAITTYREEMLKLIQHQSGFHFGDTQADLNQIEDFSLVDMGKDIKKIVPNVWELIGALLDASSNRRWAAPVADETAVDEDVAMDLGEIGEEGHVDDERQDHLEGSDAESSDDDGDSDGDGDNSDRHNNNNDDNGESSDGTGHAQGNGSRNMLSDLGAGEIDAEASDDESEDEARHSGATGGRQRRRRRKQDPAKRNAALIAIVSFCLFEKGFS